MTKLMMLALTTFLLQSGLALAEGKFEKSTPALIEKGKKVFTTNCASCHGEKGDGNGPAGQYLNPKPRNFSEGKFKFGTEAAQVFATVNKGIEGTAMVSFAHLPEEDRWAAVHYVRTFLKK